MLIRGDKIWTANVKVIKTAVYQDLKKIKI